jgi:hypothetical protein
MLNHSAKRYVFRGQAQFGFENMPPYLPPLGSRTAMCSPPHASGQAFRFATNRKDLSAAFIFTAQVPRREPASRLQFMDSTPVLTPALAPLYLPQLRA